MLYAVIDFPNVSVPRANSFYNEPISAFQRYGLFLNAYNLVFNVESQSCLIALQCQLISLLIPNMDAKDL